MNKTHITGSPLCWPEGWPRGEQDAHARFNTKSKVKSQFSDYSYMQSKKITIAKAADFVLDELRKMGIPDYMVIISTDLKLRRDGLPYSNQKEPGDKGVAVWFRECKDGSQQQVIALDQYNRIADNLYAIGKTIESMRGIKRWGGGEILNRTFTGFVALPDNESWWHILGVEKTASSQEISDAFKRLRIQNHPDKGGSADQFYKINEAYKQATNQP